MRTRLVMLLAALPLAVSSLAADAAPYVGDPVAQGEGLDLTPVAHLQYSGGSDLEFVTIKGRPYAVAPAMGYGLRLIDISKPERPKMAGRLSCRTGQLDVQVMGTLVALAVDDGYDIGESSACYQQVKAKREAGLFIVDIAKPKKPKAIGFVPLGLGAHNSTWHPGGTNVYDSDSELTPAEGQPTTEQTGRIQVIDVSNPRKPKQVYQLGLPTGLSSHDVTFNKKGDRGYSAAITQTLILDTTDPAKPKIITTILDPSINISHGADPTPDGKYLLVTDEQAGAAGNGVCNVGGVHVFDISVELAPVKVGFYMFDPTTSATATTNSNNLTCTAHVLDYSADGKTWSNAGYAAGVRIVSATELLGAPKELAWFTADNANTWSAKSYKGSKYLYSNDMERGFDVFEWEPGKGQVNTRVPGKISFRTQPMFGAGQYCFNTKFQ